MADSQIDAQGEAQADSRAAARRRTIAVIDGNSLMHRAFHAIRQPMNAPDGRATNALFGFFNMFIKLVESFDPDGVICAFDKGKPQVRIDMLPQYKAQRPPMDPALHEQFPMVKDLLRALDVPVVECPGWEGDDILGTLARRGEAAGYDMLLFTGDRDMYQLATERVKIVATKKGVSDVSIMTPESVDDLYHGITPELVPDFYGLKGDSSDNIPGVPGIGPKKAAALIVQYGNLDEVIAHADEVKGKMGENLRAHIDDALLSRKVATILTNAPIELELSDAKFPTFDPETVVEAFSALGFTGMTRRLVRLGGAEMPASARQATNQLEVPEPLEGDAAQAALGEAVLSKQWVAAELQKPQKKKGQQSLFDEEPPRVLWLASGQKLMRLVGDEAVDAALALLVREGLLVGGDVKALLHELFPMDSAQPAKVEATELDPARLFDVAIAGYLLDSDSGAFSVAELYANPTLCAGVMPEATDELPAAALDVCAALQLVEPLSRRLGAEGAKDLFRNVEMPLLVVLLQMERCGLYADAAKMAEQSAELGTEIEGMVSSIHEQAGEKFNLDSPQQLSHVLFDVMGLPTQGLKKTKKGFYSTNAKILGDLARDYEVVQQVLEYRERAKIKSTYLDALPALIRSDHRVHTTLNQTVAATGRLSSSEPNLQNIPTRSQLGHRVRTAFTVPEGSVFLACDYSQIELRLLAHLSGDEHLVAAFNEGADFHAATAARVFGVPVEEVTPQLRSRAKAVNFGIVYGQQAYGLATSLKIGRAEAQGMIDRYFEAYPGVRQFLDASIEFARKTGFAITMYGRRRQIKDIKASNFQLRSFAERTAMNHPMQGTAADIIKIAMIRVADRLREEGLRSKLVLQIHDELDFEVPVDEVETLSELVRETMEGVADLRVPLLADVSYGSNWAEAK
ncbi:MULTISPECIES: DNA polymerase I [Atopobiaceae]|uniref:DNA polymerase I n=1 Tax=Parafannyhessea umbonata TaxID=604330 RepID=A0A1H6K0S7_9ACTN|nr:MULTISPECIES: DNA polymerase I [Atopobiaceae]SEH66518.1 DNA polymerase I [Parafannyhessea umbonata]SJZ86007.1 DNA polymerase I [Olsenella sp. KH1P3]